MMGLALGCGPGVEDVVDSVGDGGSSGAMESDSSGTVEETGVSGSGSSSTSGTSGSGSAGSGSTGDPQIPWPELDGITVDSASHGHQCIDGCESFYYDDRWSVELTSEVTVEVEVEFHDMAQGEGSNVALLDDPIYTQTVTLPAGEPTRVDFTRDEVGFCSMSEWNEPATFLFVVDDIPVEVLGRTSGGFGWDC